MHTYKMTFKIYSLPFLFHKLFCNPKNSLVIFNKWFWPILVLVEYSFSSFSESSFFKTFSPFKLFRIYGFKIPMVARISATSKTLETDNITSPLDLYCRKKYYVGYIGISNKSNVPTYLLWHSVDWPKSKIILKRIIVIKVFGMDHFRTTSRAGLLEQQWTICRWRSKKLGVIDNWLSCKILFWKQVKFKTMIWNAQLEFILR